MTNKKRIIYYPSLSNIDLSWYRLGGPGLANCMFIASRAYILCIKNNGIYISPTWSKLSIGPILRHERDKRIYSTLFYSKGVKGIKKLFLLIINKLRLNKNIKTISGLNNYFQDLNESFPLIKKYFELIVKPETINGVKGYDFQKYIAIHVRLGDYLPQLRISINWYLGIVSSVLKINPEQKFMLFSDGTEEELKPLLSMPNVERVFFGNAFADMYAMSKCKFVVASDSTFSAWGAFLGQRPILFNRRHFPPVYNGNIPEIVVGNSTDLPSVFRELVKHEKEL